MTKPALRERLTTTNEFVTVTELISWRGPEADTAWQVGLAAAHALVDDPRIAPLSITDGASGNAIGQPARPRRTNTFLERDHSAKGQP